MKTYYREDERLSHKAIVPTMGKWVINHNGSGKRLAFRRPSNH